MDTKKYVIKQISIFSENRPGRLASVAQALGEEKINILAFSIAEANGFGVIRALVDRAGKSIQKIILAGIQRCLYRCHRSANERSARRTL